MVAQPRVMVARLDVAFAKFWRPVQVLLLERRVEDAAVIVAVSPLAMEVPLMVASAPVMRLLPIVEEAITRLFASSASNDDALNPVK